MCSDFASMNKKKRNLYETIWGSKLFDFPVEKTNNSYSFTNCSSTDVNACCNRLIEIFEIENKALFAEKMRQSCSGAGQELRRIATVHSSSLCALLFFYNVTPQNPLKLELDGQKCIFEYSCFEYQNKVIEGRNPSNMDVVLVGRNLATQEKTLLFLESKFSEYYESQSHQLKVAKEYLDNRYGKYLYSDKVMNKLHFSLSLPENNEKEFTIHSKESCYINGIKQMFSHYIGVRNLLENPLEKQDLVAKTVNEGAKIYLGEILFDIGIGDYFEDYLDKYKAVAEILNEHIENDGLSNKMVVLKDLLKYSMFENNNEFKIENRVRRFFLMNK